MKVVPLTKREASSRRRMRRSFTRRFEDGCRTFHLKNGDEIHIWFSSGEKLWAAMRFPADDGPTSIYFSWQAWRAVRGLKKEMIAKTARRLGKNFKIQGTFTKMVEP